MKKRHFEFALTAVVVGGVLVGSALATPSSGITASFKANAGFVDRVNLRFAIREDHHGGRDTVQVRNAEDTVMQQIVFAPNGQTGWHSHPGPAVALVKSGELTLYSGDDETCTGRKFSAGQAFIDSGQGHVHLAQNQSQTQNAEVWVTFFDVPAGTTNVRVDAPAPGNCPF